MFCFFVVVVCLLVLISVFVAGDDGKVQDPGQQVSFSKPGGELYELCGTFYTQDHS